MSLKGTPGVLDIRTLGLVAAIDLPRARRIRQARLRGDGKGVPRIWLMFRITGDTIALSRR